MSRRILFALVVCAALVVPRSAEAGLLEFIWEMSGPQMIGGGAGCTFNLKGERQDCRTSSLLRTTSTTNPHGPFIYIGGAYFFSTSKDSRTANYDWFSAHMLAFEPGVFVRSRLARPDSDISINHGAGLAYGVLFGRDFDAFDKLGITIVPVEVEFRRRLAVGFKVRIYPNGFTDDEFGFGPRLDFNRPAEITYGASVSYIFKQAPRGF